MPVLLGSASFVLASQVQVYQTCSVDLTWHRAIHSCQRCARAVASSVSLPPITQSSVERTISRFCPAGVHMSTCVPASEIFTSSGRLSASRPQSALIGSDFDTTSGLQNHVAVSDSAASGASAGAGAGASGPAESAWGPPNLPAPAANPHHPVHAAHLSRASYPPASTTSVTISHVTPPTTPPAKSTTSTAFHHFSPVQPSGNKLLLNGSSPTDTVSMTTATITPTISDQPLPEGKPEQASAPEKEPPVEDAKKTKVDILFEQTRPNSPQVVVATPRVPPSVPDESEGDKSVTIVHEKEAVVVEEPLAEEEPERAENEEKDQMHVDEHESSGEPEVVDVTVVKKPKKEEPGVARAKVGSSSERPPTEDVSTWSPVPTSESGKESDKMVKPAGAGYLPSPTVLSIGPASTILPNDTTKVSDSTPSQKPQQQAHINREQPSVVDTSPRQNTSSTQGVRSPSSTTASGGVGDVSPALRASGKVNNATAGGRSSTTTTTAAAAISASERHVASQPPRYPVLNGSARQRPAIPTFYYPQGVTRLSPEEVSCEIERARRELTRLAEPQPDTNERKTGGANQTAAELWIPHSNFGQVARALNCPLYWKYPIYTCSGGISEHKPVQLSAVLKTWNEVITSCSDEVARFVYLMTKGKSTYLVQADFSPLIQDILDSHPGLAFLQAAKDFHSRYVATVVARIFFNVNSSWSGRISLGELRHSNFLAVLSSLEDEVDINLVTQYFSYEHFYVIYCKFWELDEDHDLIISRSDLARHNNYALSERMINRIFSGTVTRGTAFKGSIMYYHDFVWFLLAEEDKLHPRSIEYWFRCMDLDGDGLLSMYELEYFYTEQMTRIEDMGIDPISFEDCLCQCLDMVKPELGDKIRLSDLKQCGMCNVFFDTFFNLPKYLQHEQRDPFTNLRDIEEGLNTVSYWDRFAAEAYEMLVAVEGDHADDYPEGEDELEEADGGETEAPATAESPAGKENGVVLPNNRKQQSDAPNTELMGSPQSPESDHKSKRKRATAVDVK